MSEVGKYGWKIGDKGVVVDDTSHGYFDKGDIVTFINDDDSLSPYFQRGSDGRIAHCMYSRLTKIEEKQTMKQFKEMRFEPKSEAECIAIQKVLFGLGYKWGVGDHALADIRNRDAKFLYTFKSGRIGYDRVLLKCYAYMPLYDTSWLVLENVAQETIEILGKTYLKSDVEKTFSQLTPVK